MHDESPRWKRLKALLETAKSHRAAAAFLAGKRIASNTRYYKRYA